MKLIDAKKFVKNLVRLSLQADENSFKLSVGWCLFKIQRKKKFADFQLNIKDQMSLVSTPTKIRWTIPLTLSN
jgi:hypothetical protein